MKRVRAYYDGGEHIARKQSVQKLRRLGGQNIAVERRHEPCRHICTALRKLFGDGAASRLYVYYTGKTEAAGSRRHLEQRRDIEMRCVRSAAYDKDLYHFDIPSIP